MSEKFELGSSVFTMAATSEDLKKTNLKFYSLGKKLTFLRNSQRKLRFASKNALDEMKLDFDLIDLDCGLQFGTVSYEDGLVKVAELEDDILKNAVNMVEEYKKEKDKVTHSAFSAAVL